MPTNNHTIAKSSHIQRGAIITSDGVTLAESTKQDDGTYARSYPQGSLASHTVGYMSPSEAVAALTKVGLNGQAGDSVYSTEIDNGKVAEQTPAANSTAKAGDTVTYSLSKGAEMVTVPSNLVGYSKSYVTGKLDDAGLKYTTSTQSSSTYDEGLVISVSPSGGSSVAKGSTVTVTVSSGPATTTVPNVIGSSESSARSQLGNFTVKVQYQSSSSYTSGTVIDQSPSGGKDANNGSTVVLTVSSGPAESGDTGSSSSK